MPTGLGVQLGLGGGRSATTSGAPAGGGACVNDYSCAFDGADDAMELGDLGTAGRSFGALSFWANADDQFEAGDAANRQMLLGWRGNSNDFDGVRYGYFSTTTSMFSVRINNVNVASWDVTSGDKLPVGWHHIVFTHNGTGYTFYVDGVLATSNALGGSITTASQAIITGSDFDDVRLADRANVTTNNRAFDGKIDELALFDTALSASNISDIYNSGTPNDIGPDGLNLSPSGWWRMGDGTEDHSGATVYDMSVNSNNGTLINGADYSTTVP